MKNKILNEMKEKIKKRTKKILELLYPEIKDIKATRVKITRKKFFLILLLTLSPIFIAIIYIYFPLKISSLIFLTAYFIIMTAKIYINIKRNKRITKEITRDILLNLGILFLWLMTLIY